jgi:hypothetical protein
VDAKADGLHPTIRRELRIVIFIADSLARKCRHTTTRIISFGFYRPPSLWLPTLVRATLLKGFKKNPSWMWYEGEFAEVLFSTKRIQKVKWTRAMLDDIRSRIHKAVRRVGLPDSEDQLLERFKKEAFAESYLTFEEDRRKAQMRQASSSSATSSRR